jgi:pimeloyl-ACP methyl ester carboxylesterase
MRRFIARFLALGLALCAPLALADTLPFPPGFSASVVIDPVSFLPVQLISGGKAGAPTVVLIHGLGAQASQDWLPVLPALARQYRVLILDLPGFGRSDLPDAALSPQRYADLVHWLIAQHTSEPVAVIGHSLGGAVALRHSYAYPQQVRRLLLIDAAGILQTTVFARYLSRVPEQVEGPRLLRRLVNSGGRILNHFSGHIQDLSADHANMLAALAGSDRARGMLYKDSSNINAALGLVNEDFSPVVRGIAVPVWMLWGERDAVAPLRTGQALRALLPRSQLDILPEVGHVPMKDAPLQTVQWMLAALEGAPPRDAGGAPGASQGDGACRKQANTVFRGRWRSIRLVDCTNVRIEDAQLEQLVVIHSTVTMDKVGIESNATALEATDASITATGLRISGARAMRLDHSRLDLAAAQITAREFGDERDDSLIFFSLSYWCDGADEWRLHNVWKPRAGKLDPQFRKQRGGTCAAATTTTGQTQ